MILPCAKSTLMPGEDHGKSTLEIEQDSWSGLKTRRKCLLRASHLNTVWKWGSMWDWGERLNSCQICPSVIIPLSSHGWLVGLLIIICLLYVSLHNSTWLWFCASFCSLCSLLSPFKRQPIKIVMCSHFMLHFVSHCDVCTKWCHWLPM